MRKLTTVDFEASCLPRHGQSYPLEVGIADERGIRSWLILPEPEWLDWGWTEEADQLNGLSREHLLREGRPAHQVAAELAEACEGRTLVADSMLDAKRMATLMRTAGLSPPAIDYVTGWLDRLRSTDEEIGAAVIVVDRLVSRRHRAGDDALWLYILVNHLSDLSFEPRAAVSCRSDRGLARRGERSILPYAAAR